MNKRTTTASVPARSAEQTPMSDAHPESFVLLGPVQPVVMLAS